MLSQMPVDGSEEGFEIIHFSECGPDSEAEDAPFEWIEWEELVAGEIPDEEDF